MMNKVEEMIDSFHLSCGAEARYIDLVSEIGELGKELLKGSKYHSQPFVLPTSANEEMGDCLFSLLALCAELQIDPEEALDAAIAKYRRRFQSNGSIGHDFNE
ncbi:MAG: nucleotide pyrophosphohydrolase [Clostridia bacterium]|nr:nucleotide pyrophosphohydrolase [Clostridia bacterium]MBQ8972673.1 nucleotide pyrophosphohydrolase [Clostridia bacterium]